MDITVNGQTVSVDDSFKNLPLDKQNATVDEIAKSLPSVKTKPTETPKEKSSIPGLTTPVETAGGAALMMPTSKRKAVDPSIDPFGLQKEKMGQVPLSEYGSNIRGGALAGGVTGGIIGAITGPGALVTATGGAVMGGLSGLAESVTKDLGYGSGVQTLAGLAAGMPAPVKGTVDFLARSKLASSVFQRAEDAALSMIPKYKAIKAIGSLFGKEAPSISGKEAEKALGVTASTKGATIENRTAFQEQLESSFGKGTTTKDLYESSKTAYDDVLNTLPKEQLVNKFNNMASEFPKASRDASMEKIRKVFTDEKGNPLSGQEVVNNLQAQSDKFQALTKKEQDVVREQVNKLLIENNHYKLVNGEKVGLEQVARNAKEKEFVAEAKDMLPTWFQNNSISSINNKISNFGKDDISRKVFKEEFAYYLKGQDPKKAQRLWANVGPNIKKYIIQDPAEFEKIQNVINMVETPKDLSRAANVIIKASYGAYETQRNK